MIVVTIEQRDADRRTGEGASRIEAAEASTDDHDMRVLGHNLSASAFCVLWFDAWLVRVRRSTL
jgi:hypothetical protein